MTSEENLDENVMFTCKTHSYQYSFGCKECEHDMEELRTTFECKTHEYHSFDCKHCKNNHHLFHARFRPAFEDCPTCWKERDRRLEEEKQKRKRDGIEKRKQTIARKKAVTAAATANNK